MADRACHCGFKKGDPHIVPEPEYSLFGWLILSMVGITPKPEKMVYRCSRCRAELGETRDPRILRGDKIAPEGESPKPEGH